MTKYAIKQNLKNTRKYTEYFWKEIDIILPEQHNSKAFSFRKKKTTAYKAVLFFNDIAKLFVLK